MTVGSDSFAGAPAASLPSLSDVTNNTTYTIEPGEPDPYAGDPNWGGITRTAWWTVTVDTDIDVQVHSQRSYYLNGSTGVPDTLISVWVGDAIDALTLVTNGHADTSAGGAYTPWVCAFHATAGQVYRVQVSSIYSENIAYLLTVVEQPTTTATTPVATTETASRISLNGGGSTAWQSSTSSASPDCGTALSAVWNLTGGTVSNTISPQVNQGVAASSATDHPADWYGVWASLLLDDSNAPTSGTATEPSGPTPAYDATAVWTAPQLQSQDASVALSPNASGSGIGPNPAWNAGDVFHVIEGASGFDPSVPYQPPVRSAASVSASPQLLSWSATSSRADCQVNGTSEVAHFSLDPTLTTVALTVLDDYTYRQTSPADTSAGVDVGYVATFSVIGTYQLTYSYNYVPVTVAGGGSGTPQPYRARLRLHPIAPARHWPREAWRNASSRRVGGYD